MSGGGGGGPSQTTTVTSNIPEYARPYVENMLEAGQRQLFNMDGDKITGFKPYSPYSTDPTKYFAGPSSLQQSAYGAAGQLQSPTQYQTGTQLATAAGMGGLGTQGQAQGLMGSALGYGQAGAGYGQAGQMYGAQGAQQAGRTSELAQQLANMYGQQGSMYGAQGAQEANLAAQQAQRAAQMYGQQGAMFGQQAANLAPQAQVYGQTAADIGQMGLRAEQLGRDVSQQARDYAAQQAAAGQQYARQATSPGDVSAYMSPYQQAVTDVAKNAAVREAQMAETAGKLASARSGTYGGARQALMSAEREKNLLSNLSNIQAQGAQSAYDKAIQSMQYGSNLGLQGLGGAQSGLGTALQGAQTGLSGIGTAMQGQQAGLSGLQQAGSLYGQGMQGAQTGLSGVGQQLAAGQLGLSGAQAGMQGAGVGLSGVGQQLAGGQLGLQGTAQGIQGAQAGMQGAGVGLSGIQAATGAGQYGLQGLSAANAAAGTLGQLGTSQQAADINAINLQNQLGQQQQQYQQNIINQAIQDYATAQQYPYMQLSTMSNLLRGLPMQSMSTQQYQAQAPMAQQAAGLLGAYGAYKGAFKEGGAVQGYFQGDAIDDTRSRIENLLSINPEKAAEYVNKSSSREVKKIGRELGIGGANVGKLGTNMAGGGIIAFNGEDGSQVELSDEEKKALEDNAYLRRSRAVKEALAPLGQLRNYDPVQKLADLGGGLRKSWTNFITEKPEDQAKKFRSYSNRTEQAANPDAYVPAVKTASQRQEDAEAADTLANVGRSKIDYNKADQILKAAKNTATGGDGAGTPTGGAGAVGSKGGASGYGITGGNKIDDEAALARYLKLTGQEQTPQEMTDYLNMLKQKSGKVGELSAEAGRMNKALAFLEGAQDPRGIGSALITGGKSYLAGEAANRDKFQKMELEYGKAISDYRKAEIERAKGNYEGAMKFEDKAKDREKDLLVAQMQMNRPGEFERMYAVYAADEKAAGRTPSFEGFKRSSTFSDEASKLNAVVKADATLANNLKYQNLLTSKKPEDKALAAQMRKDLIDEYMSYIGGGQQTASAGGGNRIRFDASGKQI